MMARNDTDPLHVTTPRLARIYGKTNGELATMLELFDQRLRAGRFTSLSLGVPEVDDVVNTMWPGTLTMIVARPSNMKSTTLKHLARRECERIMAAGREQEELVIFVSLEESERAVALDITGAGFSIAEWIRGDIPPERIIQHSDVVARWPLFVIGYEIMELARLNLEGGAAPRLTAEQVYREVEQAHRDGHGKPAAIFVDYAQRSSVEIRSGGTDSEKSIRVGNVVARFSEIAKRLDVPVVMAVQAGRQVDDRVPPVPSFGDGQWSSQLEQDADVMLSLWYPAKTETDTRGGLRAKFGQAPIEFSNIALTVDQLMQPDVLTVWLKKQRDGVPMGSWVVKVDPVTGVITPWPKPEVRVSARPTPSDNGRHPW